MYVACLCYIYTVGNHYGKILKTLKVSMAYILEVKWSLLQMEIEHCGVALVIGGATVQLKPQTE